MAVYHIVEHFISINGEGSRAGQLALFLRLKGCNLNCSYCDTSWANENDCQTVPMTEQEILTLIKESGIFNVTITGGEPLNRPDMVLLLRELTQLPNHSIEIETNGSIDLNPFCNIGNNISFTMDYKLPGSGMESSMLLSNLSLLTQRDTLKFVVSSHEDLIRTKEILERFQLFEQTAIYLSPVFGQIEPKDIVAFMQENQWNHVHIQLQLHKFIWSPDQKGV